MNILFENLEKLIDAPNGIEEARELILQLALQGKLVNQDPNDETSKQLLNKIKIAKENHLEERGMRQDDFNYAPAFNQIPYELPYSWEWIAFGELVLIIRGITFPSSAKFEAPSEGLCVCLRTANVQKNVDWNRLLYIPIEYVKNDYQWVEKNDILISMANSLELVGKVSFVEEVPVKATFGGFISVIRSFVIDPIFLWYALKSPFIQSSMRATASQTTNIANISLGGIKPLPFPLPPLNEQKRIVEKVNSLMALLDELEEKRKRRNQKRIKLNNASLDKLLTSKDDKELKTNWKQIEENFSTLYSVPENVDKLKQAILQLAVQGKLVKQDLKDEPASELLKKIKKEKEKLIAEGKIKKQNELPPIKEEEKPFELPKGWEWVRLGNLLYITSGDGLTAANMMKGNFPVYGGNGVNGYHNKYNVDKVTLVIGRVGFYCGSIHITPCKAWITDNAFKTVFPEKYLEMNYVSILLRAFDLKKDESATAQPVISGRKIYPILLSLPPLNEQKRIVEKVNELMSLCNTIEEKLIKKEATAERLVGAVVNAVANKSSKPKDDRADKKEKLTELVNEIIKKHHKGLEKLR